MRPEGTQSVNSSWKPCRLFLLVQFSLPDWKSRQGLKAKTGVGMNFPLATEISLRMTRRGEGKRWLRKFQNSEWIIFSTGWSYVSFWFLLYCTSKEREYFMYSCLSLLLSFSLWQKKHHSEVYIIHNDKWCSILLYDSCSRTYKVHELVNFSSTYISVLILFCQVK